MDSATVTRALATTRLAIGAGMVLAPQITARMWIGPSADADPTRLMARAAGARDVGLALGTIDSLSRPGHSRPWLGAAVLADSVDALATLAARRALPQPAFGAALAGASAAAHLWLLQRR